MTPLDDERVQRLYGLPLEEFTPERNALVAELRAEGDHAAAEAVKQLRKPTAAAWAVNQLVRAEPDLVEALLGAGGELRQAHRQAASGRGAEQLRAAAEAERAAVELLISRGRAALGRPVIPAIADAIRNTLHAASSDDEARERVRTGTLAAPLRPVGLGPAETSRSSGRTPREDDAAERRRRSELTAMLKAAKASEAALLREVTAAEKALARAEQAYARARAAADLASERAADARARLRASRNALQDAQRRRGELERDS